MTDNPHTEHSTSTLSLSEVLPDGSLIFQTWDICTCTLTWLRDRLSTPQAEALANASQVDATARAAESVPGVIRTRRTAP